MLPQSSQEKSMNPSFRYSVLCVSVLLMSFATVASAGPPRGGNHSARGSASSSVNRGNNNVNRNTNINSNRNINVNSNRNVNVNVDVDHHHGGYYGGGYNNGCCYHPVATVAAVMVTAAVIGSMVNTLPPSCSTVIVNGFAYQQCGSMWYQPQLSGGSTTYVVINPPH
jgi:hypothetical protein